MATYFGQNKQNPQVHNHPRATAQTQAYGTHLTSFATAGNPQETSYQQGNQVDATRNTKRTRDGALRADNAQTSYAAMAGGTTTST